MYAIVDIETTGGHAAANGITEIAVYIHDGEKVVKNYNTLINPLQSIPPYITALTGISNAMVASAPLFEEVAEEIFEILNGQVFVAHNVNFDYSFVRHHLGKHGFELDVKRLCTVRLSRKVFEGLPSYSLGKLCRSLDIEIENRHRADGDAKATTELFSRILSGGGVPVINQMLKRTSSEQWLPPNLDKSVIKALPTCAGVYYFHDNKGKVIYVGKAINIRKRVSSHFTHNDAEKKRQHFLRLVSNITFRKCSGELHALVLESTEIKRLWPKYNYSQKQPGVKYGLYSFEDGRGYLRLAIDKKKKHFPSLYNFNLLQEGRVMLKKMAEEFGLDKRYCYLDAGAECTVLSEEPEQYNLRVSRAIEELGKRLPTFAIVDSSAEAGKELCMLVERGAFWGMGYVSSNHAGCLHTLKEQLDPFPDNDFIRNSIYAYAEANPSRKVVFG